MTSTKINQALSRSMTRGGSLSQFNNSMNDLTNKKDKMLKALRDALKQRIKDDEEAIINRLKN